MRNAGAAARVLDRCIAGTDVGHLHELLGASVSVSLVTPVIRRRRADHDEVAACTAVLSVQTDANIILVLLSRRVGGRAVRQL